MKIKCTNLSRNLNSESMKAIYKIAYKLDATEIIINHVKYGKYADVTLYDGNDCIEEHYIISL